jgi:predicted transcriptional regulator
MDENPEKDLKAIITPIYTLEHIVPTNTMGDSFDLFFRRKPAMMLIALKKVSRAKYGSQLAKEVDCTYSHAVKILQTLEELGLVSFEKKGRSKIIKLTKKGTEVAENIESIRKIVS